MATMTVTELRARLREALERVAAGEDIGITRRGELIAALVRAPRGRRPLPDTPAIRAAERLREEMEAARHRPMRPGGISRERAEELVRDIRRGRGDR